MTILDERMRAFLDKLIDPDLNIDHGKREPKPEEPGPDESGVENCSLDDLCVKFAPEVLRDHLPVFGDPSDIISIHRDNPGYLNARRSKCEGGCDGCSSHPRGTRDEKQDEEDK